MTTLRLSLGGAGPIPLTGTSPSTAGHYYALQAGGSGCTLSAVTGLPGTWTGFTIAAGSVVMFGANDVTQVTLSAGSALLYQR